MELKQKKRIGNILFGLVMVVMIVIGTMHRKERNIYKIELQSNASYAVGEVTYYLSGRSPLASKFVHSTGREAEIEYHFISDDKEYKNRYSSYTGEIPSDGVSLGEKYFFLYLKDNPEESRMFFKYPIIDSSDFNQYVKEFKNMQKQKK